MLEGETAWEDAANAVQQEEGPTNSPLPIPYTAEEVGKTFADLLTTFDFAAELHQMGIGRMSLVKRSLARKNLAAISIALWHIALERSFPKDAGPFFDHFVATYPPLVGEKKAAAKLRELVTRYDTLVAEKKETDFTQVADALIAALKIEEQDCRRQRLKLSLRIRTIYELIFAKLI